MTPWLARLRDRTLDLFGLAVGEAELLGFRYPVRKYTEEVDEHLIRGSRQDRGGLTTLREQGAKFIVNLCAEMDEAKLLENIPGFPVSVHIPVIDNTAPGREDIDKFLLTVRGSRDLGFKVFVHCEAGIGRTGCMVAAYRIAVNGWSNADALAEAERHGLKIPVQRDFILGFRT